VRCISSLRVLKYCSVVRNVPVHHIMPVRTLLGRKLLK
jgi:hypothetical protein